MNRASSLYSLTRRQSRLVRLLLHDSKTRAKEGAFVLEGAKPCHDVIRLHPQAILSLIMSPRYLHAEDDAGRTARSRLAARQFMCSDAMFDKLSDVETPQGVLAVVRRPQWNESRILGRSRIFGIYGDRLQDPANVGVIIRTAAALSLTGVWLSPDSADPFGPKVVRSASGAVLSVPVFRGTNAEVFIERHCSIYSALVPSPATVSLRSLRTIPSRLVIAVGNEGEGLAEEVVRLSAVKFSIPLSEEIESLNVGATVAIAAFYLSALPLEA